MHYTVYKITNKVNGKIYIGKHQTKDLNDGYMGSGKRLTLAIEKYGIENFEKEILFVFDNEIEMNEKEAELVSEEFVKKDTNYNLCPGGKGGWGYVNSSGKNLRTGMVHSEEARSKMSHPGNTFRLGMKTSDETKRKLSIAMKGRIGNPGPKSKEHRKKISEALKGNQINAGRKFPNRKKRDPIEFEIVQCPHCNKKGKKNAMKRWHFDNCRQLVEAVGS